MQTLLKVAHKVYPFKEGNKVWALQNLKAYFICVAFVLILALINAGISGQKWLKQEGAATGESAFDEFVWLYFCTFHGMTFGEYFPRDSVDRTLICFVMFLGYHFLILTMAIVLLSQLTGEKQPTLISTPVRIFKAEWPTLILVFIILLILSPLLMQAEKDSFTGEQESWGVNDFGKGFYVLWAIFHKRPYGEYSPRSDGGKVLCAFVCLLGNLYQPYILALVSIRRPTQKEHNELLQQLKDENFDHRVFGRGYMLPPEQEQVQQQQEQQPVQEEGQQ